MCIICTLIDGNQITKREAEKALKETVLTKEHREDVYKKYGIQRQITSIEYEGVDYNDAPDFSDAYLIYAEWEDTGEALTDTELENLDSDYVYELIMRELY